MNFYLDFEAAQFSEEIISIGCIAENGNTFYTLVKPQNLNKVTKFITELTGITKEMLIENGVSANEAFLLFKEYVKINTPAGETPTYYCYGNSDADFIKSTLNYMSDFEAINFAGSVKAFLVDYAREVKSYFASQGIALRKLVTLVRHETELVPQDHDALEDARMLKECVGHLEEINRADDATQFIISQPARPDKKKKESIFTDQVPTHGRSEVVKPLAKGEKQYLDELRASWQGLTRELCFGDCSEAEARVKLSDVYTGEQKYFSSPRTAALFINLFCRKHMSPKKLTVLNQTAVDMFKNPNNFCKFRCELMKKEEVL